MGKIIKENGKIWLEEIQDAYGHHKKMILIGNYDENEEEKKMKLNKQEKRERAKKNWIRITNPIFYFLQFQLINRLEQVQASE